MAKSVTDLFAENKPTATHPRDSTSNPIATAAVLVLVLVLIFAAWQKFGPGPAPGPGPGPNPKPPDGEVVTVKDGYLLFVHERKPLSVAHADMLDVVNEYCIAHPGLEYRSVDDDLAVPEVKKIVDFAKTKGVDPPLVVYRTKAGEDKKAAKFPETKVQFEAFLK